MSERYTVVKLAVGDSPFGLTYGVYKTTAIGPQAIALCFSEDDANHIKRELERETTLADHAESWARERGMPVPARDTSAWRALYERWHEWAFQGIGEP